MADNIIRLYDRSRVVCDWHCPRERYLRYEAGGRGFVSTNTSLELFLGTCVHDGLAALAYGVGDIDSIAEAQRDAMYSHLTKQVSDGPEFEKIQFANEQASLVEGLLRGFAKQVWPRLMEEYPEIVLTEQELTYEHDGLIFMSKPDLVVRSTEGELWYVEYKTTSTKKEEWINSWNTAIQLHSTCRAIQSTIGEAVAGVIVQGLYKGYESYGKQSSPFCYAYRRNGTPPFSRDETVYEYKAGFKRYPTWELQGGTREWVDSMPESVLVPQFPQTPPIYVNEDMIDRFFEQRSYREQEIAIAVSMLSNADEMGREGILDVAFPQKFDACNPGWGRPCGYRRICHGHVRNPFEEGFVPRTPHHKPEMERYGETEK